MNKSNTKRWMITALWTIAGAGAVVLLVAAINKKNSKPCSNIAVQIMGVNSNYFVDEQDILKLLNDYNGGSVIGKPVDAIALRKSEEALERNVWIKDAELFIDNQQVLQVRITEREPIARIFQTNGNSFYIDSSGAWLPLSEKLVARLPVFTGFPDIKPPYNSADSALVADIREISSAIVRDSFWLAQVAQADITPQRNFEMIPVIGNHIIQFGDGHNAVQKLRRLFIFYQSVLAKTGFEKYSRINVQYAQQVIGTKRGTEVKIDTLLANRAVQQLANIPMPAPVQVTIDSMRRDTTALRPVTPPVTAPAQPANTPPRSNPVSTQSQRQSNPLRTTNVPKPKPKPKPRQPRAVMRPANDY
jgi:cell division protein FtsQ